ncbi:MAG: TfoX/Sxy family protein [Thermoplasmata archaeon]
MRIPPAASAAVQAFERFVPGGPNITLRKMFGQPAAFVNGNLFFSVYGKSVLIRLPRDYGGGTAPGPGFTPFEPMPGRRMTGYWVLPPRLLRNEKESRTWVARSLEHAARLPPKKPKRKST